MFNIFKKEIKGNPTVCIFIGRSGCGKGTQAELHINKLKETTDSKVLHIETGSFLRSLAKKNTYTAERVKDVIENGGLIPESIVIGLWANYLTENFTGKESLVFDGAPRRLLESEILDNALIFYKITKYNVVYINVSKEWATDRLVSRERNDDTTDGIEKRMEWFDKEIMPSIEFFRNNKNCNFIEVNGEQTIEQVHTDIASKIFKI